MSGKQVLTLGSLPVRSPKPAADWIHRSPHSGGTSGIERIEAFFHHAGYAMHRHDTYAIGRTLAGVQSFRYRGSTRNSLPGGTMVLHPDEPHDGQAGTRDGFHYRMIYVDPALFQQALGGKPLPFLEGGLSNDPRLFAATESLLRTMDCAIDSLEQDDALYDLAIALDAVAGAARRRAGRWITARRSGRASICLARSIARSHSTNWRRPPAATAGVCRGIFVRCSARVRIAI